MLEVSRTPDPSIAVCYDEECRQFFTASNRRGDVLRREQIAVAEKIMHTVCSAAEGLAPHESALFCLQLRGVELDLRSSGCLEANVEMLCDEKAALTVSEFQVKAALGHGSAGADGIMVTINLKVSVQYAGNDSWSPIFSSHYR